MAGPQVGQSGVALQWQHCNVATSRLKSLMNEIQAACYRRRSSENGSRKMEAGQQQGGRQGGSAGVGRGGRQEARQEGKRQVV